MNKALRTSQLVAVEEIAEWQGAREFADQPESRNLRVISLFAGIGGFDRAFELESSEIVMQCEIDRFCQSILQKHWPEAKLASDIKLLQPEDMPDADIWTAGFPCQDVSLARGNHGRNGLKGSHTSLFFELMRLVDAKRPRMLLLENVLGLLNSHNGCDFATILTELIERGYAVSWRVMNARYFGVPQSRPRVFICAWLGDYKNALSSLFEAVESPKVGTGREGFISVSKHASGAFVPHVAYCVAATSGRHTGNDWSRSYISYSDAVRRPTPTESERLQGFPANWTLPDKNVQVPARGFDSERYKSAGNSVAVPVVSWIAKRIKVLALAKSKPSGEFHSSEDVLSLAPELRNAMQTLSFSKVADSIRNGTFTRKWKSGGIACGDLIVEGSSSHAPSQIVPALFVDILDAKRPAQSYFLTANAAVGILRRVASVGRTLFPPMQFALEKLAQFKEVPQLTDVSLSEGNSIGKISIRTVVENQWSDI